MPFDLFVALRYLREGRLQTWLILAGVGVGVGVIIFLSALINGLQKSLIDRNLFHQRRPTPQDLHHLTGGRPVSREMRGHDAQIGAQPQGGAHRHR